MPSSLKNDIAVAVQIVRWGKVMLSSATWYFQIKGDIFKKIVMTSEKNYCIIEVNIYDDSGVLLQKSVKNIISKPSISVSTTYSGIKIKTGLVSYDVF